MSRAGKFFATGASAGRKTSGPATPGRLTGTACGRFYALIGRAVAQPADLLSESQVHI